MSSHKTQVCEIIFDVFLSFCKIITFLEMNEISRSDDHPLNFDISENMFSSSKLGCFQILIEHNIYE